MSAAREECERRMERRRREAAHEGEWKLLKSSEGGFWAARNSRIWQGRHKIKSLQSVPIPEAWLGESTLKTPFVFENDTHFHQ